MGIILVFTPHGFLIRGESFSSEIESCTTLGFVNAMIVCDTQSELITFSAYSNVWDLTPHGFLILTHTAILAYSNLLGFTPNGFLIRCKIISSGIKSYIICP